MKKGKIAILVILLVLFIDQLIKIWIKTHMELGDELHIANWFRIHFTENPGMAFGMEFGGSVGKLALSVFRIVAIAAITYYLYKIIKEKKHTFLIISISLILAGAVGNILDSAFYGLIFDKGMIYNPAYHVWMPYDGVASMTSPGYAHFLKGCVVDMFYFPLINGHFPQWLPIWGGEDFEFFRPVFNLADSSITVGVAIILLFQKKFFKE